MHRRSPPASHSPANTLSELRHLETPVETAPRRSRKPRTALNPRQKLRRDIIEKCIEFTLFLAAASSVAITIGIVVTLFSEAIGFFKLVSVTEFLTTTDWSPQYEPPGYGVLSLVCGTLVTTLVALAVALPLGTVIAIYLSEFATPRMREWVKPTLELLSAVPTVVYGFFALMLIAPVLKKFIPGISTQNMLSAGIAMGIMIIPYVSSLSEDAMRAVPMLLREGSFALGGNRLSTAFRVVYPSALSGIAAAYILGISRAIGETMIVAVAGGLQPKFTLNPTESALTMTAFIVGAMGGDHEHGSQVYYSVFAVGLLLFLCTFAFNCLGHYLRARFREAY